MRSSRRRPVAVVAPPHPVERRSSKIAGLWSDGFGTLATRAVQIIAVVALLIGLIIGLRQLTVVVIPLLLALIISCAFEPLMMRLRARMPNSVATLIVLLGVIIVLGAIVWAVVEAVADQWEDLADSATSGVGQIVDWIYTLPFAPSDAQLSDWVDELTSTVTGYLTSSSFGSTASASVSAVASFATGAVLFVVVLFFFLKDGPTIWAFLCRPFEGEWYDRMRRIGEKTVGTFGSYVRGTASVAAVDAIGIGIGLAILGIPLWPVLTILVFILAFIPIVGATLAGVLGALVALVSNGWVAAVIVVAIVIVVNQLEGNLLQPVLMGRALQLHAFVILIALTVGTTVAGILGAILAAPLAAAAWGIVQVWDGPGTPARWAREKIRE
ncbi:MAG: AI-2E family transporter [Microbacterium sp.]